MRQPFQFRLRTILWLVLAVGLLMVPAKVAVQEYLRLKYIYTIEGPRLKAQGKPAPWELEYKIAKRRLREGAKSQSRSVCPAQKKAATGA